MSLISYECIRQDVINTKPELKLNICSLWNGWVVDRLKFAESAISGVVSTVHNLFRLIYNTVLSATFGLVFTNAHLRNRMKQAGHEFSHDVKGVTIDLVGVVWPNLARSIEDWRAHRHEEARIRANADKTRRELDPQPTPA